MAVSVEACFEIMDEKLLKTPALPSALDRLVHAACSERHIVLFVAACAAVKCLMAVCFPFTGDEAYLALWGKYPAWGYYDHPPLVGWLTIPLMHIGGSPLLLRLMPIVFGVAVAAGIYALLRPYDKSKARLACVFFMVCPFEMLFIFLGTDVPLMLFCFLSAFFFFKAANAGCYWHYTLCGVFLGLAFLSKYFAVLLGLSYLVYFILTPKTAGKIKGFAFLILACAPFVAQNIIWNYHNGWPNVMHNWYNRLSSENSNVVLNLLILAGFSVYVFTFHGLYFTLKNKNRLAEMCAAPLKLFAIACAVPLIVFVVASFGKTVRPHWFFFLLPFAYIVMAILLEPQQLYISIKYALVVSSLQAIGFCAIPLMPIYALQKHISEKDVASVTVYCRPKEVLKAIDEFKGRYVFATESFSVSALLEYTGGDRVIVYAKGSHHGRQDDFLSDFRKLDGKNMLILRRDEPNLHRYNPYFESVETRQLKVGAATFHLILCNGFRYQTYRQGFLTKALKEFYQIPAWLPYSNSPFHEKYGF